MLEVRNLSKIFIPKKGVPVKALQDVSIKFPENGMLFLLGKSGSGKSTLLNLLGGLEKYSEGDILINQVSTKTFTKRDFDAYRNQYLGFIFQDYNLLSEFSVGQNIAIAIELQGRKVTDNEINTILCEVDLEGFGNRKLNELSGGQLQRVAIARALVKNPRIILADEPTGALDSATGRQVFTTLKQLSKERLVVVVSHDRELAEEYADRIIELADGRVISDMESFENTYRKDRTESTDDNLRSSDLVFDDGQILLPEKYRLTVEDLSAINDYLEHFGKECAMKQQKKQEKRFQFRRTDESKISHVEEKKFEGSQAHLPLNRAFSIGMSSLGYKKVRLCFTILISVIAFSMFGISHTISSYTYTEAAVQSIAENDISYVAFEQYLYMQDEDGGGYWLSNTDLLKEEDITYLRDTYELEGIPVYALKWDGRGDFSGSIERQDDVSLGQQTMFNGIITLDKETMSTFAFTMSAGTIPDGTKNELAISEFVANVFLDCGFVSLNGEAFEPKSYEELLGKEIACNFEAYTICGVVDTNLDHKRYEKVLKDTSEPSDSLGQIKYNTLSSELNCTISNTMSLTMMVGKEKYEQLTNNSVQTSYFTSGMFEFIDVKEEKEDASFYLDNLAKLSDVPKDAITWLDGERTELSSTEILLTSDVLSSESITPTEDGSMNFYLQIYDSCEKEYGDVTVVGIIDSEKCHTYNVAVIPDELFNDFLVWGGKYSYFVARMPSSKNEIRTIVEDTKLPEKELANGEIVYHMVNPIIYELEMFDDTADYIAKVFFWLGIGLAIFSSILFMNYLAMSINQKEREIGILRALGARRSDVRKIFLMETGVVALADWITASVICFFGAKGINYILAVESGMQIRAMQFGWQQVFALFGICVFIAAYSCTGQIHRIAAKAPIDAIRGK